jgi:hypothetical protein
MAQEDVANQAFIRQLKELTGEDVTWEEPSEEVAQTPAKPSAQSQNDEADWASDCSTDMVLSLRNMSVAQTASARAKQWINEPTYDLRFGEPMSNSSHQKVSQIGPDAETGLKMGEASTPGQVFCPWKFVVHYPTMYVGKRNGERASPFFEDEKLLRDHGWDLYVFPHLVHSLACKYMLTTAQSHYLHYPSTAARREPTLFVPTSQFERLLDVINKELSICLTIPGGRNTERFNLTFGLGDSPTPRFLGRVNDEKTYYDLKGNIPALDSADSIGRASEPAKMQFLDTLDMIYNAATVKGKNSSEKTRRLRLQSHLAWGRSVKRVQRYLGLRHRAHLTQPGLPKPLDLSKPLKMEPDGSVIFAAIDLEAFEFNHDLITEVGVAILDTKLTQGVAPGEGGRGWFKLVKAHHFRIQENLSYVNGRHVEGHPYNFDFG